MVTRFILSLDRTKSLEFNKSALDCIKYLPNDLKELVVGLDISGDPTCPLGETLNLLKIWKGVLPITIHTGEIQE